MVSVFARQQNDKKIVLAGRHEEWHTSIYLRRDGIVSRNFGRREIDSGIAHQRATATDMKSETERGAKKIGR